MLGTFQPGFPSRPQRAAEPDGFRRYAGGPIFHRPGSILYDFPDRMTPLTGRVESILAPAPPGSVRRCSSPISTSVVVISSGLSSEAEDPPAHLGTDFKYHLPSTRSWQYSSSHQQYRWSRRVTTQLKTDIQLPVEMTCDVIGNCPTSCWQCRRRARSPQILSNVIRTATTVDIDDGVFGPLIPDYRRGQSLC